MSVTDDLIDVESEDGNEVAALLWREIERLTEEFGIVSHRSDLLLAVILAYYQVRGTVPEAMISGKLREHIAHHIERMTRQGRHEEGRR